MGVAQSALILLGIGIISSRFKAGVGLGELGTGIQTLVAAPLTGTGTGLSSFALGLRDLAESFGDLGRGFGALFENIPQLPPTRPGNGNGQQLESLPVLSERPPIWFARQPLITNSGGSASNLLPGGGGNVPVVFGPIDLAPMPRPRLPSFTPPPVNYTPTLMTNRNRDVVML